MRRIFLGVVSFVLLGALSLSAAELSLIPYPHQLKRETGSLSLSGNVVLRVVGKLSGGHFAATQLAGELSRIDHVNARILPGNGHGQILLASENSKAGARLLEQNGITYPAKADTEGYVLIVTKQQAAVVAHSAAGLFYGVQTLRQLIRPDGKGRAEVPALQIQDWPAMRWRGVQVDMSRGPVTKLKDLERAVVILSQFKVNNLMLYFENVYSYPCCSLLGLPAGDGFTPKDAKALVSFAKPYHVMVIPEQETIGHVHHMLQYQRFQNMAELPFGNVLSPTVPGSLKLIGAMFHDLAQVFPSRFLDIGADETFELGQGRTKPWIKSEGYGQVYVNYLKSIDKTLQPEHRQILFWGDMARKSPKLISQIPHNMIAVPWDYWDTSVSKLKPWLVPYHQAGLTTWVAPGVANWSQIFPAYTFSLKNIRSFTQAGLELGSTGVLNTTWNDDGESLFDYCWYGLAYGAEVSWSPQSSNQNFQQAYDWDFYRNSGHQFESEVADLTKIEALLQKSVHTGASDWLVWQHPFTPKGEALYSKIAPVAPQIRLLAEDVVAGVRADRGEALQNQELLDYVLFAARRLDYLGQKALYTQYINNLYTAAEKNPKQIGSALGRINKLLDDLRDSSAVLLNEYRTMWLRDNTPYYLDDILLRYQGELNYWHKQIERFSHIRQAYQERHGLPPLFHNTNG